jgi:hypothetical protein
MGHFNKRKNQKSSKGHFIGNDLFFPAFTVGYYGTGS